MRDYEIMFIFDPAEDKVNALKESVQTLVKDTGGEIYGDDTTGVRKLAYPIKKREQGYYYILNCKVNPERMKQEFDREVNLQDDILKYMAIRKSKEK